MITDYLVSFDTGHIPEEAVDFLIIGMGVAGMRAALELKDFKTLVIVKDGITENSTYKAQGGVAVPIRDDDSASSHIADTLRVGCGISDEENVKILVAEGLERIRELISWGLGFDTTGDGSFQLTREGGHSSNRVLHIEGDFTGKGLFHFLHNKVAAEKNINIKKDFFLIDILAEEGRTAGALVYDRVADRLVTIRCKAVILASGGAGNVYQETSNPSAITGDGIAAAYRRGVDIADVEFYQFHPTTLYLAGAPRFLISESVRGEGGILRDKSGDMFMASYHPDRELAPRDVVSRAIIEQMRRTGTNCVYLDLTSMEAGYVKERFPQIYSFCINYGIDISRETIPVRPSAHYFIGGVKTDRTGRTGIEGLYACGETAATGVHGANRLASNSLLEGLVFGARAGADAATLARDTVIRPRINYSFPQKSDVLIDSEDLRRSIRSLMWRNVGIERDGDSLEYARKKFNEWTRYAFWKEFSDQYSFETLNILTIASLMVRSALERTESRGTHFRKDYPESDDAGWKKHITLSKREVDIE